MIVNKAINFRSVFFWKSEDKTVEGITIPIVQRDYAQGRENKDVKKIRNRFLKVLYDALVENQRTTLDFVYGNIENRQLIPLDGQQRLTTLFLLHYYIAHHEQVSKDEWHFLHNFTYETRISSREFCKYLVEFIPDFTQSNMSGQIKDEPWFPMEWESDPTVLSMLVMLDDIHRIFKNTNDLWTKLTGDAITFYFLPLSDLDVTDELYIKMNSRGKPLTNFEHFKAELELRIKEVDPDLAKEIMRKIDQDWTDMLWPYRDSGIKKDGLDDVIDDEFLRYIHFISDIIGYEKNETEITDDFEIIEKRFAKSCGKVYENLKCLEKLFDIWTEYNIDDFFNKYIATGEHERGKILIDSSVNLFRECCRKYGNRGDFSLSKTLMLYAFICYLVHKDDDLESAFPRRLRIVNNLIRNSSNEIRSDNMIVLLAHVKNIILNGVIEIGGFQNRQVEEERKKLKWTNEHTEEQAERLYCLEDHKYLNGFVEAVADKDLGHVDWCNRFYSLFNCDLTLVNRALLTKDDCFEKEGWRYQIGIGGHDKDKRVIDRLWRELFGPIRLQENMCESLHALLEEENEFTDERLTQIIDNYLQQAEDKKEYPFRYYLVKYESMRSNRYSAFNNFGKFYWRKHNEWKDNEEARRKDYNVILMTTEWQLTGFNYDVFLKAIFEKANDQKLDMGDHSYSQYNNNELGDGIKINSKQGTHYYLTLSDNVFHVYQNIDNSFVKVKEIKVTQEAGIDVEDRVNIGLKLVNEYMDK